MQKTLTPSAERPASALSSGFSASRAPTSDRTGTAARTRGRRWPLPPATSGTADPLKQSSGLHLPGIDRGTGERKEAWYTRCPSSLAGGYRFDAATSRAPAEKPAIHWYRRATTWPTLPISSPTTGRKSPGWRAASRISPQGRIEPPTPASYPSEITTCRTRDQWQKSSLQISRAWPCAAPTNPRSKPSRFSGLVPF